MTDARALAERPDSWTGNELALYQWSFAETKFCMLDDYLRLAKRYDALHAKVDALTEALQDVLHTFDDRHDRQGHPDHCHRIPGIWDEDNGARAGKPCADCAAFDRARVVLAQDAQKAAHTGDRK